jgi:hypothetical protein
VRGEAICNLCSHVKGPKAIRGIANAGDRLAGIFPDGVAPVVRAMSSGGASF